MRTSLWLLIGTIDEVLIRMGKYVERRQDC